MSAFARSHEATKAWWVALPLMKAERVLSTRWAGVSLTLPVYLLIMKGHFGWVPNAKPRSEYAWAGSVFGIPRISNLSTTSEPFPTQGLTLRPPALVKGALLPHLETDPYSGTWKSTSTGAVLRIAKVRNGWSVTDPLGQSGLATRRGNELVSKDYAFKRGGSKLACYVDGLLVMYFARE